MGWLDEVQNALGQVMQVLGGTQPQSNQNQFLTQQGINLGGVPGASTAPGASSASAGSPGVINVLDQLLPLLLAGGQTFAGIQYGGSELQAMQDIYNMQKQAARQQLAIQPGQLGVQAARMAQPLNKQLAYQLLSAAAGENELSGMSQSPGATAAGNAKYLVPAIQQNLGIGAQLAQAAEGDAMSRGNAAFNLQAPQFMGALGGIGQLGAGSALPPYLLDALRMRNA